MPRILLAEDNPMNQKLAVRLLEKLGYMTEVVGNGQEAVDAVMAGGVDIVLMDVQMPELDGLEATRRIRAQAPTPRPWIVAMTANAMDGDREACLAAGMDGYISQADPTRGAGGGTRRGLRGYDRSPDVTAVGNDLAAAQARIAELEAATAALGQQQRVQAALYRIAETANAARDLHDFYASIHEIVSGLTYGENFYIALYDREREMVSFPYFVDSVDKETPDPDLWESFGSGWARGLTAFVLRTGLPQHVPDDRFQRLVAEGEVEEVGADGEDWLGVPHPIR